MREASPPHPGANIVPPLAPDRSSRPTRLPARQESSRSIPSKYAFTDLRDVLVRDDGAAPGRPHAARGSESVEPQGEDLRALGVVDDERIPTHEEGVKKAAVFAGRLNIWIGLEPLVDLGQDTDSFRIHGGGLAVVGLPPLAVADNRGVPWPARHEGCPRAVALGGSGRAGTPPLFRTSLGDTLKMGRYERRPFRSSVFIFFRF